LKGHAIFIGKHPEKYTERICLMCGKTFAILKSHVEPRPHNHKGNGKYCSRYCSNKAQSKDNCHKTSGEIYGHHWYKQSQEARKHDNYTCQICGIQRKQPALDVHHIIPIKSFKGDLGKANASTNLITLCRSCHTSLGCKHIALSKDKLPQLELSF
jgi:5-methylcytosine-specific restriction endonuclease McrA